MATPLKYRVTWTVMTVGKPDSGSRTVTMEVKGLAESVTLARDVYAKAERDGEKLDLSVSAPTGGAFLEWSLSGTPF